MRAARRIAGTPGAGAPLWEITVSEAMHAGIVTCPVETPLSEVARIMAVERIHCVVVMAPEPEGASPWGVVSDLDLVAGASVRDLEEQTAGGSAATPVVVISLGENLLRAAQLMTEHATAHLVVVDAEAGLPVGILSSLDIARALASL